MLLNDNDLREKMRLAARQKALACYAEAVVAKQYADLYAAVLQAR